MTFSSMLLLVIAVLAAVFFLFGLVQLLVRCLMKGPSFSSVLLSDGSVGGSNSRTFHQRQLRQLFQMHDSGLDHAIVEALPVFCYKEIEGLKDSSFDCAVCLCEFSDGDKLKLLVNCSHAFHVHCIETWLLSNSTCPLCRGLIGSAERRLHSKLSSSQGWNQPVSPGNSQENAAPTPAKVFSVRLGKFRNSDNGLVSADTNQIMESSRALAGRRCYSMGAFRYIISDTELQVIFSGGDRNRMMPKAWCKNVQLGVDGERINLGSRGESISISKIWLWSKKGDFLSSTVSVPLPVPCGSNIA